MRQIAQIKRLDQTFGQSFSHRGDQVRAAQNVAHTDEVRNRQPHIAHNAGIAQQLIHAAMHRAGRLDNQMLGLLNRGQRYFLLVQHMATPEQADIALAKQLALKKAGAQMRHGANGQIHQALFHLFAQIAR